MFRFVLEDRFVGDSTTEALSYKYLLELEPGYGMLPAMNRFFSETLWCHQRVGTMSMISDQLRGIDLEFTIRGMDPTTMGKANPTRLAASRVLLICVGLIS